MFCFERDNVAMLTIYNTAKSYHIKSTVCNKFVLGKCSLNMISSPTNVSSLLFYCTSLLKGSTFSDKPNSIFDISTLSGRHQF